MSSPPSPFDVAELQRRQAVTDRLLATEGAAHLRSETVIGADGELVEPESRPWRLDPIPLELTPDEFTALATAVTARVRAFEAILADLYGPRRLVRAGIVPASALYASRRFAVEAVGRRQPRRWLTCVAVDVVRLDGGSWRVVGHSTDAPSGLGYALLDREVMARAVPGVLGTGAAPVAPVHGMLARLHRALTTLAAVDSPRVVVLSGGNAHPSYVEHGFLAAELGFHLVEAADLVVRHDRLWLRTLEGLEPVDVVYRRLRGGELDPLETGATGTAGVPGLLGAASSGAVALANANGAGVLEDPALVECWPAAGEAVGSSFADLAPLRSTEWVRLARQPVLEGSVVVEAPVVLRLHVVAGADGVDVLPGGIGRLLSIGDDPGASTRSLVKDVWVRGIAAPPIVRPASLPQVDLVSVPTRAADALYAMNVAAERAEALARATQAVQDRLRAEAGSASEPDLDGWMRRAAAVLRVVRHDGAVPGDDGVAAAAEPGSLAQLLAEVERGALAMADRLGDVLSAAAGVGEYLSTSATSVLERLATYRRALAAPGRGAGADGSAIGAVGALDALSGLWHESTVRGPAWWIGDIGRRLERALVVLGTVEVSLTTPTSDGEQGADVAASTAETVLAVHESLVPYRRRHRSRVDVTTAADLLLRDTSNPRSFAASLVAVRADAEALGWDDGARLAERAGGALHEPLLDTLIPLARATVIELGRGVVDRWFAVPVHPSLVGAAR